MPLWGVMLGKIKKIQKEAEFIRLERQNFFDNDQTKK
jgi:hypothetical protein